MELAVFFVLCGGSVYRFGDFVPFGCAFFQFPRHFYAYLVGNAVLVDERIDDINHLIEYFFNYGIAQTVAAQLVDVVL